jgi:CHAT domain-containing protein
MLMHREGPRNGYDGEALQASELSRARALLDTLNEAKADIREGVDPQLLERERSFQQRLNARAQEQMNLLSGSHTEEQARTLAKEIEDLTTAFEQVRTEIRQTSPRYAALTQPRPLTPNEIQATLDEDTLLLEYSLGSSLSYIWQDRERSYVWAVTSNSIKSYQLAGRREIEEAARSVYDLLNSRNKSIKGETQVQRDARIGQADRAIPAAASVLSRLVLGPVAAQLGKKRLVIVADGMLHYIPFAMLPDPTTTADSAQPQPLIIEHEIVNLPSASTLAVIRQEVAGRELAPKAVVALADPVFSKNDERIKRSRNTQASSSSSKVENPRELELIEAAEGLNLPSGGLYIPRLRDSRKEAQEIVAMVPAAKRRLALDFEASRKLATSIDLRQYRYIHFSTHGWLNSLHPELSGIVFSLVNQRGEPQDGFLRAHETFNLKLPAELVVLSACQTGIGKEVKGEGLVSLTRGFMYAGAPRVVVSLWSVSEMGTTELMVRFYSGMLKNGLRPAAALRLAQLSLMKEKRWESPFYWAPFILQGEWR